MPAVNVPELFVKCRLLVKAALVSYWSPCPADPWPPTEQLPALDHPALEQIKQRDGGVKAMALESMCDYGIYVEL